MLRHKTESKMNLESWLLLMTIIPLFFFFFNTQMHERYIHPAIGFSTLLAFRHKHYGPWIIISLAYALSLESICKFLHLNNYGTMVFHPKFIAAWYGISLLWYASVIARMRMRA